jgi:hypothetical protein
MKRSHLGFDYVDVDSLIPHLLDWVRNDNSFYWTRFNDGELNCMLGLATERASIPGYVQYLPEIREQLSATLDDIIDRLADGTLVKSQFMLGCFHNAEWWHPSVPHFHRWLDLRKHIDWRRDIPWSEAEVWYNTAVEETGNYGTEGIFDLLTALRVSDRKTVLVGNDAIEGAKYCMDADFISIPFHKTWESSHRTMQRVMDMLDRYHDNVTFVWCGGFPAKIWMHDTWSTCPDTAHLDFGHFFDGAFGRLSRAWLQRKNSPHRRFYMNRIAPWIKSYIRK